MANFIYISSSELKLKDGVIIERKLLLRNKNLVYSFISLNKM